MPVTWTMLWLLIRVTWQLINHSITFTCLPSCFAMWVALAPSHTKTQRRSTLYCPCYMSMFNTGTLNSTKRLTSKVHTQALLRMVKMHTIFMLNFHPVARLLWPCRCCPLGQFLVLIPWFMHFDGPVHLLRDGTKSNWKHRNSMYGKCGAWYVSRDQVQQHAGESGSRVNLRQASALMQMLFSEYFCRLLL